MDSFLAQQLTALHVTNHIIPSPNAAVALDALHLADAPDYFTAIAAGEAHGLVPTQALKAAFGKWLTDHADAVQRYELANFYDGQDASRAFVNYSRLAQFLVIVVAEQGREIAELKAARHVED